jgi:hypothetical protein
MSLTFKAIIDGVHIDPKKGSVKIQLVATSSVSLDKLTTLSPKDESIQVTLESEQTKIDVFPLATPNAGDPITLGEQGAELLEKAARELEETPDSEDEDE